jgi:hypothetical protein
MPKPGTGGLSVISRTGDDELLLPTRMTYTETGCVSYVVSVSVAVTLKTVTVDVVLSRTGSTLGGFAKDLGSGPEIVPLSGVVDALAEGTGAVP